MSIIGSILFFFIFVFFIIIGIGFYILNSVFRLFGIGRFSHKNQKDNNSSQSSNEESTQNMTGKKKIFDKDEGEYVDFEEEKK